MPSTPNAPIRSRTVAIPATKQAADKKTVYSRVLREREDAATRQVQAALKSARAGELLFRKS